MTGKASELIKATVASARRGVLPMLARIRPGRYTDAAPYKIIHVPTELISRMQGRWQGRIDLPWLDRGRRARHSSLLRRWHAGIVLDGDWDQATRSLDDYHLSRVIFDRFILGRDWYDIPYVRKALRRVANGEPAWGRRCTTREDILARCRFLDALHDRLKSEGYNPRHTLDHSTRFTHFLVNIGRGGEIIRNNDGKHRIILARALCIESLPARVFVRHAQWQAVRDAIRNGQFGDVAPRFRDHPDLQDILPPGR